MARPTDGGASASQIASCLRALDECRGPKLSLANCFLGDEGARKVATALRRNQVVSELDISGNQIKSDGAVAIGEYLAVCGGRGLRELCLEWNSLGLHDAGIRALASALEVNTSLVFLDVRNNKLGPETGSLLVRALARNRTLQTLDIRWNELGSSGGIAVEEAMRSNSHLTTIHLTGNRIDETTLARINDKLRRNAATTAGRPTVGSADAPAGPPPAPSHPPAHAPAPAHAGLPPARRAELAEAELASVMSTVGRLGQQVAVEQERGRALAEQLGAAEEAARSALASEAEGRAATGRQVAAARAEAAEAARQAAEAEGARRAVKELLLAAEAREAKAARCLLLVTHLNRACLNRPPPPPHPPFLSAQRVGSAAAVAATGGGGGRGGWAAGLGR
jgi:hypothetical protein